MPEDLTEAMRQALAAADHAARAIALELDYSMSTYPSFTIPTALLEKVNAWREAEALLFTFLPEPTMPLKIVGLTQDQERILISQSK